MTRLALISLAALIWADAAAAQEAPTIIIPDTGQLGLGTRVATDGSMTRIDGGRVAGQNLFHSFSRFDLGRGDTAAWVRSAGDGASILNVISRVTGGDPSDINGRIDTTALPNASFFLINPAGIVFGAGARVDVAGAAHFSTAHELRFAGGPAFAVTTPTGSTFSVAAPRAFGFVGGQGDVAIRGAEPGFTGRRDLSVSGRDVSLLSSQFTAGSFAASAVGGSAVELDLARPRPAGTEGLLRAVDVDLRAEGARGILLSGGRVELDRAFLVTTFSPDRDRERGVSGPIDIAGDIVTITRSFLAADTFSDEVAGDIRVAAGDLTIADSAVLSQTLGQSTGTAGRISLTGGRIRLIDGTLISSSSGSRQAAGDILIDADQVEITATRVASDTNDLDGGAAGTVTVRAGALTVRNGEISSNSSSRGDAGTIIVDATRSVDLGDASTIFSRAEGLSGRGGEVAITAPAVRLSGGSAVSTGTETSDGAGRILITSDALDLNEAALESVAIGGGGDAGQIVIRRLSPTGGQLTMLQSRINSDTRTASQAGGVDIATGAIFIGNGAYISSNAGGDGGGKRFGGTVSIRADRLTISDTTVAGLRTGISSDITGQGAAGAILINVGDLSISGRATISSNAISEGVGGEIMIRADTVSVANRAEISTDTFGSGRGGSIDLQARRSVVLDAGAAIASRSGDARSGNNAPGRIGAGGSIMIDAPEISILRESQVTAASFTNGAAGSITITGGRLLLDRFALITSAAQGSGDGGPIAIRVGELLLSGASFIDANSLGSCTADRCDVGDAGSVTIVADIVRILGDSNGERQLRSRISSSTDNPGDAGNISITAGALELDDADIASSTQAQGAAGSIDLNVGALSLVNASSISTSSEPFNRTTAAGHAGDIRIQAADAVTLTGESIITSSTNGSGNAGAVGILADAVSLTGRSRVTSSALRNATGRSGRVGVAATNLAVTGASAIETTSASAASAGEIGLSVNNLRVAGTGSRISSANSGSAGGSAGEIFILGRDRAAGVADARILDGARITTNSATGRAGDIAIGMARTGILRIESLDAPSAIETSSGPGTGGRIGIGDAFAIISNGGSILALGQLGGANVEIVTRYFISSSDRTNRVAVDGNFLLEAAVYDVSSGTVTRDLSVLDASSVLRGQCASARATGQVSQLVVRPVGPYGQPLATAPVPGTIALQSNSDTLCS